MSPLQGPPGKVHRTVLSAIGGDRVFRAGRRADSATTRGYLGIMKVAGIKELKARLSEYLRLVRTGHTILVTDRNEVIAELRPPVPRSAPQGGLDEALDRLAAAGELRRAGPVKGDRTWHVEGLGLPEGTALELLDTLRSDP